MPSSKKSILRKIIKVSRRAFKKIEEIVINSRRAKVKFMVYEIGNFLCFFNKKQERYPNV